MGCMIAFLVFIILLGTGALPWIFSSIWSFIVFIYDYHVMLTIVGLIIGFVVFAISENEKKHTKKLYR